jgi:pSer/pThr/pTyr-binding forkhead associated (FHA) protein
MICPVKTCRNEIEDDSKYCDQCGTQILKCPKCGTLGGVKFCPIDGQRMEPVGKSNTDALDPPSTGPQQAPPQQSAPSQNKDQRATTRMDLNDFQTTGSLSLIHSGGTVLKMSSGDQLGKSVGPHAAFLEGFKFISGKHAVVTLAEGKWLIADQDSTNKTRLNGQVIEPLKSVQIKNGDKIILADQEFTVNEN